MLRKITGAIMVLYLVIGVIGCSKSTDYSTCVVGDFVLKDGTVVSKDKKPKSSNVVAVIVRAADKSTNTPALGVGIKQASNLAWCYLDAEGYLYKFDSLVGDITSGYMDGSDSWDKIREVCSDATDHPDGYPAFYYSLTYGLANGLRGDLAYGWYLPTLAELSLIYENRKTIDESLRKVDGNTFDDNWYWSCCQHRYYDDDAHGLNFYNGLKDGHKKNIYSNNKNHVCTIRAFY